MKTKLLDFYIDESGDFIDDDPAHSDYPSEMSLVGGLLCDQLKTTDKYTETLLPYKVHACKGYKKYYIDVLEHLYKDGARFIIFENKERLKVINGDITYLNILSEGLIQLLHNIKLDYPNQDVRVRIVIATRKAMNAGSGIIADNEYLTRLEERLYLAAHRNNITVCDYSIEFKDARTYKKTDFADIICNTYLTRDRRNKLSGKSKFSDEERARIEAVYDKHYIFSVFENATVTYLKRLLSECRYGEMMYQISTLTDLKGIEYLRDKAIYHIHESTPYEQDAYFNYVSIQIGLYNKRKMFDSGIEFSENYKRYFLDVIEKDTALSKRAKYWHFDTDFYILTMYDHKGNPSKCEEYLTKCLSNIDSIDHSWEHIDYYFKFRIRELNCLMGRFDFNGVIEKSENLIKIFKDAKELFSLIETYDGTTNELKSELLGKTYGVQVEGYINLLTDHPELLDKAIDASDNAISEFSSDSDLQRQYQYRCDLMILAGKPQEALNCLLKSYKLDTSQKNAEDIFLKLAFRNPSQPDIFSIYHYTSVMLALGQAGDRLGSVMFKALAVNNVVSEILKDTVKIDYPRNIIFWNLGKWYRLTGSITAAETHYNTALKISKKDPENATMYSFSLSMVAWHLLCEIESGSKSIERATDEIRRSLESFYNIGVTESMRSHFEKYMSDNIKKTLHDISEAFLK